MPNVERVASNLQDLVSENTVPVAGEGEPDSTRRQRDAWSLTRQASARGSWLQACLVQGLGFLSSYFVLLRRNPGQFTNSVSNRARSKFIVPATTVFTH